MGHGKFPQGVVLHVIGLSILTSGIAASAVEVPTGWVARSNGFEISLDRTIRHGGKCSASIKSVAPKPYEFGSLLQSFAADAYRGKRVRMSTYVLSAGMQGQARLWMRADSQEKTGRSFGTLVDRSIRDSDELQRNWQRHEVVLDVPQEAVEITFGLMLSGTGQIWIDDFRFEVVGKEVPASAMRVLTQAPPAPNAKQPNRPRNLDFEQ